MEIFCNTVQVYVIKGKEGRQLDHKDLSYHITLVKSDHNPKDAVYQLLNQISIVNATNCFQIEGCSPQIYS